MARFQGGLFPATVTRTTGGVTSTIYGPTDTMVVQVDPERPFSQRDVQDAQPILVSRAYTIGTNNQIRVGDWITDPSTLDPQSGLATTWLVGWDNGRYPDHVEFSLFSLSLPPLTSLSLRSVLRPGQSGTTECSNPQSGYDVVGNRCVDPGCNVCYGTGVVGGYASSVTLPGLTTPGVTTTGNTEEGMIQTQTGSILTVLASAPALKRDDMIVQSPDPVGTPGSTDRRFLIGPEVDPLLVYATVLARRYLLRPIELGAPAYWVAPANTATVPDSSWGTV